MAKAHRVTMDTDKEKTLNVHTKNQVLKFKQFPNGLYGMNPEAPESFIQIDEKLQFVQTVDDNMKYLTKS